jgi:hypothetical protein
VSHTDLLIDAVTGLPANDTAVNSGGKPVATVTMTEGGPWTPELNAAYGDNALFEIVQISQPDKYEIRIKAGGSALTIGPYTIIVEMSNKAGAYYWRVIEFTVSLTPPVFKKAPRVFPYITGIGKNKLIAYWDEHPKSAEGFKLYIGTTKNSAEAQEYTPLSVTINDNLNAEHKALFDAADPSYTKYSAEITDITGDSSEGFLPNGATYYVWLKSYNSDGDSAFGPYATITTSYTIPEYLWKNVAPAKDTLNPQEDFYCWESFYGAGGQPSGDFYVILPPSDKHPGGYLIYGPPNSTGIPSMSGDIVYFGEIRWRPLSLAQENGASRCGAVAATSSSNMRKPLGQVRRTIT